MSDKTETGETLEQPEASDAGAQEEVMFAITKSNAIIVVLVLVVFGLVAFGLGGGNDGDAGEIATEPDAMTELIEAGKPVQVELVQPEPEVATEAPVIATNSVNSTGEIVRNGEGRLFYTTIKIPANAETLYLSGSGASQKADGTWGNMEEQAIDTFNKFKATLENEGWSLRDIVQVRAFAVAGDYGLLDFDGFNRGYSQFFGTQENPNKPVRSFVQVADLVVDGWLVEVEIRAARVP